MALVVVGGVRRASGEHPRTAHEPLLRVALHQQHFGPLGGVAQQDQRRGHPRLGDLSLVPFLARPGLLGGHAASLHTRFPAVNATDTAAQWICVSCGFIYDPAEGDPDGGIPAGTPFEEIPDDWFCPVCGARKKDFERYEE